MRPAAWHAWALGVLAFVCLLGAAQLHYSWYVAAVYSNYNGSFGKDRPGYPLVLVGGFALAGAICARGTIWFIERYRQAKRSR